MINEPPRMIWMVCLLIVLTPALPVTPQDLEPFVLPWDDGLRSPTNMAGLNHRPAGKFGHITVRDGRLFAGEQRIRLLGVNLSFGGNFPGKEDAPGIAARLAKLGINIVRFHHMDGRSFPGGIWHRDPQNRGEFDPEALDRLGFFIAALKKNGIYADLNLLVSRRFRSTDGLDEAIDRLDWKESQIPGFFDAGMLELQKQYARMLLGHRNVHTGLTFASDPAVAIVEINNENGLIHSWMGGKVDALPKVYLARLEAQWNAWLGRRYRGTGALKDAWGISEQPAGDEMLSEADWYLERHERAEAVLEVNGRSAEVCVTRPGSAGWHVQLKQSPLYVEKGQVYTVRFRARADKIRTASVHLSQDHNPWAAIGLSGSIELGREWRDFAFTFIAQADDQKARLIFSNLGGKPGEYQFTEVSMKPGGIVGLKPGQEIETRSIPILYHAGRQAFTGEGRLDWIRFLWDVEQAYWQEMYRAIKEELGCKALVIGTIVGCSTPNMMAGLDVIDAHAYWQHPRFPGRPWDSENWTVRNVSMVDAEGGTIPGLASRRIHGKPFVVTEYNHPAPNTFGSEAPLLLAAYAALQDWDGIFFYSYSHGIDWDSRKIDGFFDIRQHPTKLANLPLAAMIFRGGQVSPAGVSLSVAIPKEAEIDALATRAHAWRLVDAEHGGLDPLLALTRAVGLRLEDGLKKESEEDESKAKTVQDSSKHTSCTGELSWSLGGEGGGVVTIDAPCMKAVVGFIRGRRFELGEVTIAPGDTLQDWCTLGLSLIEGDSFDRPERAILVATGYAQNTGMQWKSGERNSVGRNWGGAPSIVEIIPAEIIVPGRAKVFALDERGKRKEPVKAEHRGDGTAFTIRGAHRTLWYEISW